MGERPWLSTAANEPPDGVVVETKIRDADGERNVQRLRKSGNLWWFADGSMYVYYTPTHWRPTPKAEGQ